MGIAKKIIELSNQSIFPAIFNIKWKKRIKHNTDFEACEETTTSQYLSDSIFCQIEDGLNVVA